MAVDVATLRQLMAALPEVKQGSAYGTTAWRIKTTFLGRLRDDDTVLALSMPADERGMRIEAEPAIFFITDHYLNYDYVLIRLAKIGRDHLQSLLEQAWRRRAPKMVLKAAGATDPAPPAIPRKRPPARR